MSTTDDSFSVTQDPIDIHKPSFKERWWHIMDSWKVGIIPLPLFVLAGLLIAIDCLGEVTERYRGDGCHAGVFWFCLRRVR